MAGPHPILPIILLSLVATGCALPGFPRQLVSLDLHDETRPYMLSRTEPPASRHGLHAESRFGEETHSYGDHSSTRTEYSRTGASFQLATSVDRGVTWVQIEEVSFEALDYDTTFVRKTTRMLSLDAAVQP